MGNFLINDIHIGPLTVHMYGIMMAAGILSAYFISEYRGKKRGMDTDGILFGLFWCVVIGGFIGSKLTFYLINLPQLIKHPSLFLDFANGWVVYGSIIGGAIACIVYCRIKKADLMRWLDLLMPAVAFAQGVGRIGCTFAGCCYGKETEGLIHLTYRHSDFAPNGLPLIPTQIYSSLGDFVIAFLLMLYARRDPRKGRVTAGYCILYSIGRFVIEFFRNDYRGAIGFLSSSQAISIFILALGIFLYVKAWGKPGKVTKEED